MCLPSFWFKRNNIITKTNMKPIPQVGSEKCNTYSKTVPDVTNLLFTGGNSLLLKGQYSVCNLFFI